MAEWSKALVLGTSPKGRGFESHRCQNFFLPLKHFRTYIFDFIIVIHDRELVSADLRVTFFAVTRIVNIESNTLAIRKNLLCPLN